MKNQFKIFSFAILLILLTSFATAAYSYKCLTYGESVPSSENPRFTCNRQLCQVCVNTRNFPTHFGYCSDMEPCSPRPSECESNNPPSLNIYSPMDNFVFNSRKVLFNLTSDKFATFYYLDNINGRGRWSKLGSGIDRYSKGISFKEGLNEITIKTLDNCQNSTERIRRFFVDSKKPKIGKIETRENGNYLIEFSEENPISLNMKFGNIEKGFNTIPVNIANNCVKGTGGKQKCELILERTQYLTLAAQYNNQNIEYYFELFDIVNNSARSKPIKLFVDITPPVINNLNSLFTLSGKYVSFKINITEPDFKEVSYMDNSVTNPKYIRLCTKLKNGICEKKIAFKPGNHAVIIKALDNSGNEVIKNIEFSIE